MVRLSSINAALLLCTSVVAAKSSWSFEDGQVSVQGKGVGVDGGFFKEKFKPKTPLSKPVPFGSSETLKVVLTTTLDKKAKQPHQAFLTLKEQSTGLEESFPFTVKDTGKAKVEIKHGDLPIQLLTADKPLQATLVIASFGFASPHESLAFDLEINRDANIPIQMPEKPIRYGKLDEIHHIFRDDPKSPMKIITLPFLLAVLFTLPTLLLGWSMLGANANDIGTAFGKAPLSHAIFLVSILALEGTFFLYYATWNLFQTLPVAAALGGVAFLSGSRALSEVQERRIAGKR